MKKTVVLAFVLVSVAYPVKANPHHDHHHRFNRQRSDSPSAHSHVTCNMVRSYVAQMGLEQARSMARAAGMTASEERRAKHCLTDKV
jgi:hypothetical protein